MLLFQLMTAFNLSSLFFIDLNYPYLPFWLNASIFFFFLQSEKWWAIRLLSIACLSLAAKMEECNVPELSEFKLDDYSFEGKVIQKMELLVLSTLEWKMGIITPFDFLSYFITKFCKESPPSPTFSKTMQLIFTTMKGAS